MTVVPDTVRITPIERTVVDGPVDGQAGAPDTDTGAVTIDCDDCAVRVPWLQGLRGQRVAGGAGNACSHDERAALEVLADVGLAPRLRLVPIHRRGDSGVASAHATRPGARREKL